MKQIVVFLVFGFLFLSCSEDPPTKTEVKKGVLYGKVSITIPRLSEVGSKLGDMKFMDEIDSLQIETRFGGTKDSTFTKNGRYSFVKNMYSEYFLFYKVKDSISGDFGDMPYYINKDSVEANEGMMISKYNRNSLILKLDYPFPNPVIVAFSVNIELSERGYCVFDIIDLRGRSIFPLVRDTLEAGVHELGVMNYLPKSGIYFIFGKLEGKSYSYCAFYYEKK